MNNLPTKAVSKVRIGDLTLWFYVNDAGKSVLHRIDGPARIDENGDMGWYIHGQICHTNAEFQNDAGLTDEEMAIMILKYGNIT